MAFRGRIVVLEDQPMLQRFRADVVYLRWHS